ncbi:MAG: toxin-antitoxin system YwqK family antitoxin [Cyclobacteriaceae bacterium]|nr:toxin-antitoxin system YwqK family antitoxin [Cyclobacteriaceae bacterium HetDA_MAG_MS6]
MKAAGLVLLIILLASCGESVSNVGPTDYPAGAVIEKYDNIPGRVKITVMSGEDIAMEGDYQDGFREGAWTEYERGLVKEVYNYYRGDLQGIRLSFRSGNLEKKSYYDGGQLHGEYTVYKNRRVIEQYQYTNGKKEGPVKKFYNNGKILEESNYVNDQLDGIARWYDQEGNLTIEYLYKDGVLLEDKTAKADPAK